MTDNQIYSAWMIQDNVIFIKQFGIETKQHSKLESTLLILLPNTHGFEHYNIYFWILQIISWRKKFCRKRWFPFKLIRMNEILKV